MSDCLHARSSLGRPSASLRSLCAPRGMHVESLHVPRIPPAFCSCYVVGTSFMNEFWHILETTPYCHLVRKASVHAPESTILKDCLHFAVVVTKFWNEFWRILEVALFCNLVRMGSVHDPVRLLAIRGRWDVETKLRTSSRPLCAHMKVRMCSLPLPAAPLASCGCQNLRTKFCTFLRSLCILWRAQMWRSFWTVFLLRSSLSKLSDRSGAACMNASAGIFSVSLAHLFLYTEVCKNTMMSWIFQSW